jgi:hypothetical protein
MKEADWMKSIDSNSVCTWFYAFFIINSIFAALAILGIGAAAFGVGVPKNMLLPSIFSAIITGGIAVVNSLFFYLICQRSIATA